ncbi:MAG: phosphodiester glycosidase family protein, partial [Gemmatimonadaceae bacterium]
LSAFVSPAEGQWDSSSVETVAPGVIHRRVVVNSGPWRLNVLEVSLHQKGISIREAKGNDVFAGLEKTSSMEQRYKGPGRAVAAVNADFFNVKTGESESNVVIDGTIVKGLTPSDSPRDGWKKLRTQFGVDSNNHPYIDRFGLTARLIQGGRSMKLDGINSRPRQPDALVLYTSAAGDSTPRDTTRMSSEYLPLQFVSRSQNETTFRIAGPVYEGSRGSLAAGGALTAEGTTRDSLMRIVRRGGTIRIRTGFLPGRERLRTIVGGGPRIIQNGRSVAEYGYFIEGTGAKFGTVRHPRTAVGFSKDSSTLYLVTVDGRRESDSGMSLMELTDAMLKLGVYEAVNLDGGGSTTMVIGDVVVNHPSDKEGERPVGNALLVVVGDSTRHH